MLCEFDGSGSLRRIPQDLIVSESTCQANQTCLLAIGGARAIIDAFLPLVEGFNGTAWGSEPMLPKGDEGFGKGVSSTTVVLGNRIYVVGHTGFGDMHSRAIEGGEWRLEPKLQLKREGFALVVFQRRIWALGGRTKCIVRSLKEDEDSMCTEPGWIDRSEQASVVASNSVESINPITESEWRLECSMGGEEEGGEGDANKCMEKERSGLTAAVFDDKIFVIGGYEGSVVEVFDGKMWERLPEDFPRAVFGAASSPYGGKLWVFGGFSYDEHLSNAVAWDGKIWIQGPKMSLRRAWTAVAPFPSCAGDGVCSDRLYVVGGSDKRHGGITEVESFDGSTWRTEASLLNGRNRLGVVVIHAR